MTVFPLKFKAIDMTTLLFADDAGGFFRSDYAFLDRYAENRLTTQDLNFLDANGHVFHGMNDLPYTAFSYRWAQRLHTPQDLSYVILVPTLRCNLACGYCQVSRVNEKTPGFDWDEGTLQQVLTFLDGLSANKVKIEFQGGEPLLRLDLLERVRDFCRQRFETSEFVVCTNLQTVDEAAWSFLSATDTFISTSLDADPQTHQRQRTLRPERTAEFLGNLRFAVERFGTDKVSALPTLDVNGLPSPEAVIDAFTAFGMRSIYLRPVNFQGFARKKYTARDTASIWNAYHRCFIESLIAYNDTTERHLEEYYFVHCLRRVVRSGHDGHVDLRNPNILGQSYLVIDYDGTFYPTDEARMVTRVGQFDLSMGNLTEGLKPDALAVLNDAASNNFHPDCIHCPYQAFCGVDLVDDISRYGRIDLPKHLTDFCQRHTHIFDLIFELIYSDDPKVRKSLALWAGVPDFDASLARWHR